MRPQSNTSPHLHALLNTTKKSSPNPPTTHMLEDNANPSLAFNHFPSDILKAKKTTWQGKFLHHQTT